MTDEDNWFGHTKRREAIKVYFDQTDKKVYFINIVGWVYCEVHQQVMLQATREDGQTVTI